MFRLNQHPLARRLSKLRKPLKPLIRIISVIIILLISFFLISKSFDTSTKPYQEYQDNLIKLQQLDADFNQEILKSRYELFTSYDPLVKNLIDQQSLQVNLKNIPIFIDTKSQKELEIILEDINNLLEKKANLNESFKSKNAQLKNSLRYLPLLTNQLETKFAAQEKAESLTPSQLANLRSNLSKLIRNLLLYNIAVDEKIQSEIESLMAQLSQLSIEYGLTEDEFPSRLVESHTSIILNTKPQVEQLTTQLITPLKEETKALEILLENSYKWANILTNIYRFLTVCWLLGLLFLLNYILLKKLQNTNPKFLQYQQKVKRIAVALTQVLAAKDNLADAENIHEITDLTSCRYDLGVLARGVVQVSEQIRQEQTINLQEEYFAFLATRITLLTKNGQKIIDSEIVTRLKTIFEDTLASYDCQLIDVRGEAEQIQLLLRFPPKTKLSQLVKQIKTVSSSYLQQELSFNGDNTAKDGEFWSHAYFITSCDGEFLNISDPLALSSAD